MNIENLKQARKGKSMTQKEVAEQIGVGQSTYKNYECGLREPNGDTIVALATLFDVSTDYLLGKSEAKQPSDPIEEFADKKSLKDLEEILIREYLELSDKQRDAVLDFMRKCIDKEEAHKKDKVKILSQNQSDKPEKVEEKEKMDEETLKIMRETEEKKAKALSALENFADDEYETIIIETTPEKLRADLERAEEEQRNSQKDVS